MEEDMTKKEKAQISMNCWKYLLKKSKHFCWGHSLDKPLNTILKEQRILGYSLERTV